jgi:hypothetical protein
MTEELLSELDNRFSLSLESLPYSSFSMNIDNKATKICFNRYACLRGHGLLSQGAAIPTLFLPIVTLGFKPFG